MQRIRIALGLLSLCVAVVPVVPAQIILRSGTCATGGGVLSNGTYAAAGTIGQSLIGRSTGTTFAASAGFWGGGGVILNVEHPPGAETLPGFALMQNYPNPFNPNSDIRYQISEFRIVRLTVYDLLGREVAVLVNEKKAPGTYLVRFDASLLPSGVYFYRLQSAGQADTKKMALVR